MTSFVDEYPCCACDVVVEYHEYKPMNPVIQNKTFISSPRDATAYFCYPYANVLISGRNPELVKKAMRMHMRHALLISTRDNKRQK